MLEIFTVYLNYGHWEEVFQLQETKVSTGSFDLYVEDNRSETKNDCPSL